MKDGRSGNGGLPEGFAEDAWIAFSMLGTFDACDWYESRNEKRAPSETRKARS